MNINMKKKDSHLEFNSPENISQLIFRARIHLAKSPEKVFWKWRKNLQGTFLDCAE